MKLLVAMDLSETTESILEYVEKLALAMSAQLWLLHVAPPEPEFEGFSTGPQTVRDALAKRFHVEHCRLQTMAEQLRSVGLDATALLVQGATAETILKEAGKIAADMIVIGSGERSAVHHFFVGSDSKGVLHKSEYPVLIVPPHECT